jgi:mitogen-activated protein kinase 1/3
VNSDCDLKICDFGLARVSDPDNAAALSEYVATRWYRAPEILLNYDTYDVRMDIWSVGCVMAELISRRPLFPGSDVLAQLRTLTDIMGSPSDADLRHCTNPKARHFMAGIPAREKIQLAALFPHADPDELDLMERMLTWDPEQRITAADALRHPFLAEFASPDEEPDAMPIEAFDFDLAELSAEDLRLLIWQAANDFDHIG